ncbi:MAG: TatD family hydrolase [Rickettsiaceae bacterium]|nr:TatD family hydrolase [Rickettsiaceae bacterium]
MIVDSHCHLDMLSEYDSLDNIISRAANNGIKYIQTICVRLEEFDRILSIATHYPNVYASIGVHPNEVKQNQIVTVEYLLNYSKHEKVIGLGETGLDYYRCKDQGQQLAQIESFINHIQVSQQNHLPVIIHSREAEQDTISILKEYMKISYFPALIHCFTASKDFAREVLDLGLYISISGIVTFKSATDLQEIVKYIPADRLLVETDSPYLAPIPYRGKTNEPSFTKYVVDCLAQLKNIPNDQMADITTSNFFNLFNKAIQK